MSSLYKCPSGKVINLTNVIMLYDFTGKKGLKYTGFYFIGGGSIKQAGHLTDDILAKQDIITKMEGMVKTVMNSGYGKFRSATDVPFSYPPFPRPTKDRRPSRKKS